MHYDPDGPQAHIHRQLPLIPLQPLSLRLQMASRPSHMAILTHRQHLNRKARLHPSDPVYEHVDGQ